ncbi:MAG: hypothetical protein L0099_15225, partial [Acidobacteria bacterium]|nr:hypothetical protein [Acidobacteriota bacterium]
MDQNTLTLLTIFIAVTALAVLIQMGILIGMFLTMRKTSARVEALADEVNRRGLPVLDSLHTILLESRVNVGNITSNLAVATADIQKQVAHMNEVLDDVVDRARLQVIRGDQIVGRTLDKVEETTEMVHDTVLSPVRRQSALMEGLSAG